MTAIRSYVLAFFCIFTISVGQTGVAASDGALSDFISSLTGNWTCRASSDAQLLVGDAADTFHSALYQEHSNDGFSQEPGTLSLMATRFWDSLWSDEQVFYEFVSKTAFRLVRAADDASSDEVLTCTQQSVSSDI